MSIISSEEKYIEYKNIFLSDLGNRYFSIPAMKLLNEVNIHTLQELFSYEETDLKVKLSKARVTINIQSQNEIIGTRRILRCKYLNEDPKVSFNTPNRLNIAVDFGLSARSVNALYYGKYDSLKFFDVIRNNEYSKLALIRNIGTTGVEEIKNKTSIAYEYYMKHFESTNDNKIYSLLSLKELYLELQRLIDLQNKTAENMKLVTEQILEKSQEQDKQKIH